MQAPGGLILLTFNHYIHPVVLPTRCRLAGASSKASVCHVVSDFAFSWVKKFLHFDPSSVDSSLKGCYCLLYYLTVSSHCTVLLSSHYTIIRAIIRNHHSFQRTVASHSTVTHHCIVTLKIILFISILFTRTITPLFSSLPCCICAFSLPTRKRNKETEGRWSVKSKDTDKEMRPELCRGTQDRFIYWSYF